MILGPAPDHTGQVTAGAVWLPRLVAFDLDDTLAPSKSAVAAPMAAALRSLLDVVPVCVISGGQVRQFRDQVLAVLAASPAQLSRLHLMPTCGTRYYVYDGNDHYDHGDHGHCDSDVSGRRGDGVPPSQEGQGGRSREPGALTADLPLPAQPPGAAGAAPGSWRLVYASDLAPSQVREGLAVVEAEARRLGLWEDRTWGPVLEDRGSQITFSALGQEAPLEAKKAWDPDGAKKRLLRDAVAARLPALEVRSGGSTSVDITLKGVDKAYGMTRLAQATGIPLADMLFVGDRLDPDGNDYPVRALGVVCHAVTGWEDTAQFVRRLTRSLARESAVGEPSPASELPGWQTGAARSASCTGSEGEGPHTHD